MSNTEKIEKNSNPSPSLPPHWENLHSQTWADWLANFLKKKKQQIFVFHHLELTRSSAQAAGSLLLARHRRHDTTTTHPNQPTKVPNPQGRKDDKPLLPLFNFFSKKRVKRANSLFGPRTRGKKSEGRRRRWKSGRKREREGQLDFWLPSFPPFESCLSVRLILYFPAPLLSSSFYPALHSLGHR